MDWPWILGNREKRKIFVVTVKVFACLCIRPVPAVLDNLHHSSSFRIMPSVERQPKPIRKPLIKAKRTVSALMLLERGSWYAQECAQILCCCRLESVQSVLQNGDDDLLENETDLHDQMESIPLLCRFQYDLSCPYICSKLETILDAYAKCENNINCSCSSTSQ